MLGQQPLSLCLSPPLPRRISRRSTRIGASVSIISTGVLPRLAGKLSAEKPGRCDVAPWPALRKFTTAKRFLRYSPDIVIDELGDPDAQTLLCTTPARP